MSSQTSLIRLPTPLHAGLKALAVARNATMTDIIHDLVRRAVDDGEIDAEHGLGGLKLILDLDAAQVAFEFADAPIARMTRPQLPAVIAALSAALDEKGTHSAPTEIGIFLAQHIGTGIALTNALGRSEHSRRVITIRATRDLVRDLQRGAEVIEGLPSA